MEWNSFEVSFACDLTGPPITLYVLVCYTKENDGFSGCGGLMKFSGRFKPSRIQELFCIPSMHVAVCSLCHSLLSGTLSTSFIWASVMLCVLHISSLFIVVEKNTMSEQEVARSVAHRTSRTISGPEESAGYLQRRACPLSLSSRLNLRVSFHKERVF